LETLYEWSIDEGVYMFIVYIIHMECDDIMLSHHLQLNVVCDFIYATNEILVVHVVVIYFIVANWDFCSSDVISTIEIPCYIIKL